MPGAEDIKMVVYITPSIKKEDVDECVEKFTAGFQDKIKDDIKVGVSLVDKNTGTEIEYREVELSEKKEESKTRDAHDADMDKESAKDERTRMEKLGDTLLKVLHKDTSELDPKSKKQVQYYELSSAIFKKLGTTGFHILQQSFGLFQDIYGYMKRASPLLQSIDQMVQLAVQLFFMPLGNMLGEIILPATLDMLEAVMAIWDGMDGMSFSEAFSYAISEGVQVVATYFNSLGNVLEDQGGLIGSIGSALHAMSDFVSQHLESLINIFTNIAGFLVEHWQFLVSLFVGFITAHLANQLLTIATIAVGHSILGKLGAAIPLITAAVTTGGMWSYLGGSEIDQAAEGGYVPSRPGGKIVRVAEGGEGEYIIPESRLKMISQGEMYSLDGTFAGHSSNSSSNTYNITINGMTDEELKRYIKEIVSDQVSESRLRGGI